MVVVLETGYAARRLLLRDMLALTRLADDVDEELARKLLATDVDKMDKAARRVERLLDGAARTFPRGVG